MIDAKYIEIIRDTVARLESEKDVTVARAKENKLAELRPSVNDEIAELNRKNVEAKEKLDLALANAVAEREKIAEVAACAEAAKEAQRIDALIAREKATLAEIGG